MKRYAIQKKGETSTIGQPERRSLKRSENRVKGKLEEEFLTGEKRWQIARGHWKLNVN